MARKKKPQKVTIDWQKHVRPLDWVECNDGWYSFKGEDQEDAIAWLGNKFILTLDAQKRLGAFLADEIAKRANELPELIAKKESGYYAAFDAALDAKEQL